MILDIKRFIALGKYVGNFSYEYLPPENLCLVPMCCIDGAVKVEGEYEIFEDGGVAISLTVSYKISGQCSYCLEKAEKQVTYTTDIEFVTQKDDEDKYYYDGIRLNLKSAVDDAILIGQPHILLCKEDCKGIDVT